MYQLCSDLQVFIKCSSAQTVADGGLVSGAPGRWKHRVPLPRWSPGALTDGVNEAKLVLGLGVWKAGPRCMERVEVDEDVVVDPLEKLKLTEGGGRRGEKGYSDSREQECVVTIKQAGR